MAAKRLIGLRIGPAGDQWIDEVATETGATRALVARSMLAVATRNRAQVLAQVRSAMQAEGEVVGRG